MADMKRMTISIPAEMEESIAELRKTDRFFRSSYAEIIREVLTAGMERINKISEPANIPQGRGGAKKEGR